LQDDVECQAQSGISAERAFHAAVSRLGRPEALTNEFAKIGETSETVSRIKNFLLTLAGIPNPALATNMNTSHPQLNLEPRWATYLKSATFVLPAAFLWLFVAVFIFPKFNEVIIKSDIQSKIQLPAVFRFGMDLAQLMTHYMGFVAGVVVVAIVLLEWRFKKWARYRRSFFGVGTFLLNSAVLIAITTMVVLSLVAVSLLPNLAK
jgi:hypothetical protein